MSSGNVLSFPSFKLENEDRGHLLNLADVVRRGVFGEGGERGTSLTSLLGPV